jgi:hypothetical protein
VVSEQLRDVMQDTEAHPIHPEGLPPLPSVIIQV